MLIGEKKINLILESCPNIFKVKKDELDDKLKNIKGINIKTRDQFIDKFNDFQTFLNKHKMIYECLKK